MFTHLLLADEINRTPPKTQASLLEAMEERQVSVEGNARARCPQPFLVVRDAEPGRVRGHVPAAGGTAGPLPAQAHACRCRPGSRSSAVLQRHHDSGFDPRDLSALPAVSPGAAELAARAGPSPALQCSGIRVQPDVAGATWSTSARATRASPVAVARGVARAAPPRCWPAAKAWAWLVRARRTCTPDDVKALARPALRHRIALRPEAELEGVTPDSVLDSVLATVPVPR